MNCPRSLHWLLSIFLMTLLLFGCSSGAEHTQHQEGAPAKTPVGGEGPPPSTEKGPEVKQALYVANEQGFSVSVVDLEQGKVVHNIKAGAMPNGLVIDSQRRFAYVANNKSNDVTVIDLQENRPVAAIPVGTGPYGLLLTPDGKYLLVTNSLSNDLSIIDLQVRSVIKNIEVGNLPMNMTAVPNSTKVWVANYVGKSLTLLDYQAQKVERTLAFEYGPVSVALLPGDRGIWGGHDANDLFITDLNTGKILQKIGQVGSMPITNITRGNKVYTLSHDSNEVFLINPVKGEIEKRATVGKNPNYLTFSPDGSLLYVSNRDSNDVSVLDAKTLELKTTIKVGAGPMGLEVR